ncbi:uncharacterized protein LOC135848040 [Planococcus citri]|uniref:uncharacterized protein LOC135848040 n=1 Tax=Planococcus citri TaxID=170843 RepID=UPI0031F91851
MLPKCVLNVAKCVSVFLLVALSSSMSIDSEIKIPLPNQAQIEACDHHFSNCEYFTTYPSAYMEKLIRNNSIKKEMLLGRGIKLMDETNLQNDQNDEFTPLCKIIKRMWQPQGAITKQGEFVYIVQMEVDGEQYYQSVKDIKCESKGGPCENGDGNLTINSSSSHGLVCRENDVTAAVVGVTPRGKVVRAEVGHSTCCSCRMKVLLPSTTKKSHFKELNVGRT